MLMSGIFFHSQKYVAAHHLDSWGGHAKSAFGFGGTHSLRRDHLSAHALSQEHAKSVTWLTRQTTVTKQLQAGSIEDLVSQSTQAMLAHMKVKFQIIYTLAKEAVCSGFPIRLLSLRTILPSCL